MDSDAPRPIVQREAPDLQRLPDILDVHIRWRRFDPPRRVTVAGKDTLYKEAVEVELRVSEPFQIRALSPVLWVGDEPLTIADSPSTGIYRFYGFAPDKLRANATLALSWNSPSAERKTTKYGYSPPKRE
jgi:hypothetical protein